MASPALKFFIMRQHDVHSFFEAVRLENSPTFSSHDATTFRLSSHGKKLHVCRNTHQQFYSYIRLPSFLSTAAIKFIFPQLFLCITCQCRIILSCIFYPLIKYSSRTYTAIGIFFDLRPNHIILNGNIFSRKLIKIFDFRV